jgi:sucrose-6-phosphatase
MHGELLRQSVIMVFSERHFTEELASISGDPIEITSETPLMTQLLLCTDLDRTLIPNGDRQESENARRRFAEVACRPEITLVYVSGRDRNLVEKAIAEFAIPEPGWVIGDVGSSLYQLQPNHRAGGQSDHAGKPSWLFSRAWQEEISLDWPGFARKQIAETLKDFGELVPQEPERQGSYKLSYYLPIGFELEKLRSKITSKHEERGVHSCLIYSVDPQTQQGLLDVMPLRATKLHAVEFLMKQLGITAANTVFAGDSGNDMPILTSSVPSVLVANADPDIIEEARSCSIEKGTSEFLYLAKGNFLGMNGNYSAGILEGLAHYHPETKGWIEPRPIFRS